MLAPTGESQCASLSSSFQAADFSKIVKGYRRWFAVVQSTQRGGDK